MPDSQIRPKRKLLFTVNLELNNRLRQEGVGGRHIPDICLNERVSDWLAARFASADIKLDQKYDIAVQIGENAWRIINWPIREYAYQVEQDRQILRIYRVERPHFRVLALDAGGIAGYFNARLLQKIDDRLRQKVTRFQQAFRAFRSRFPREKQPGLAGFTAYIDGLQANFLDDVDYLMGTSAGSVNVAILAQDDKPTTQLDRCIQVWREPRLFDNEPLSNLLAIYGLRSFVSFTKYKKSLSKYIPADLPLKDLEKGALFTTFALDPKDDSPCSKPKIFNSAIPKDEDELTLDVVLRSGSAAPLGALHEGYADGGWYSASPSTHILPLFRWFTDFIATDQQNVHAPLKKALERYLLVDEVWTPLHPGMTIDYRSPFSSMVKSLNQGKMPKELHIKFFEHPPDPAYDLRGKTTVTLKEVGGQIATEAFECESITYKLFISRAGELFTARLRVYPEDVDLHPRDVDGNITKLSLAETEQLLVELREGKLPAGRQKAYFAEPPVIDLATHPVGIQTESLHYRWSIEPIVSDEETPEEEFHKFRVTANPKGEQNQEAIQDWDTIPNWVEEADSSGNTEATADTETSAAAYLTPGTRREGTENQDTTTTGGNRDDLISFEKVSYQADTKKLQSWLDTISSINPERDEGISGLLEMYEKGPKSNPKDVEDNWKIVQGHAVDFLIRQMEPATKLSLLSVGVGIKNKRLVMPKANYHWGYLHMLLPSPLNQFFSLGSTMASAQADRATEEINELAQLSDELNFHRIDPGVLSLNSFAYSALAINPHLKDTAIALLENGPRSWRRPPVGARRAVPFLLGCMRPPEEGTARRAPTSKGWRPNVGHLADNVINAGKRSE